MTDTFTPNTSLKDFADAIFKIFMDLSDFAIKIPVDSDKGTNILYVMDLLSKAHCLLDDCDSND